MILISSDQCQSSERVHLFGSCTELEHGPDFMVALDPWEQYDFIRGSGIGDRYEVILVFIAKRNSTLPPLSLSLLFFPSPDRVKQPNNYNTGVWIAI